MTTYTCEQCGNQVTRRGNSHVYRFCSRSCLGKSRTDSTNSNWRGGTTKHPLYGVYKEMLGRCHRPKHPRYADYGARGITVCEAWSQDFWAFVADVGPRPEGRANGRSLYSLDRVDNDRGYEPGNVRWADYVQQCANRRRPTRKAA